MTDKELLEKASKAVGEVIDRWACDENGVEYAWLENGDPWQPLLRNAVTDCMGDALRLAVKLRLDVDMTNARVEVIDGSGTEAIENFGDDLYAATRRAITRAAAEIGAKL